ncbi:DeoR/GlpR family DNA-binding transcription regulator [Labrys neptuniae]|uniref:DeoR/GlpR family DNA-binding transcription regulator n=1 Tax=Labrys TaxID=204476 RepID=UPI00288E5AC9|nr:DeoR/GlpR family DNA-binding transcription regulator [Labrys neptuniae]MDT3379798.1 DeoR/GlpR family DNA-binding transcription regulator [Labrys neptuniae]
MSQGSSKLERLDAIRGHLYTHGPSTIQALADAAGASLATIRRDLQILEEQGIIDRAHGGARIAEGSSVEVAFSAREGRNLAAKRALAAAAYEKLAPHATIFLDAGTTVRQLARLLRINPIPMTVFTNGLLVAQELLDVPKLRVVVIGGQLRNENASLVGPEAEAMLERLWFDQLFLGVSAIGPDATIYSVDSAEASLNARMLKRAEKRFIVTDSSKFGVMSTYAVAPLAPSISIMTDASLSSDWQTQLHEVGVPLTLVDVPAGAS